MEKCRDLRVRLRRYHTCITYDHAATGLAQVAVREIKRHMVAELFALQAKLHTQSLMSLLPSCPVYLATLQPLWRGWGLLMRVVGRLLWVLRLRRCVRGWTFPC